jgi:hypothetical protein
MNLGTPQNFKEKLKGENEATVISALSSLMPKPNAALVLMLPSS